MGYALVAKSKKVAQEWGKIFLAILFMVLAIVIIMISTAISDKSLYLGWKVRIVVATRSWGV